MNLEGGSFTRCVRHPSQFFTGFCSSCLVERLSNVDSVERSPEPLSRPWGEILEVSASYSVRDSQRNGSEVRVRKTLLSLFQVDDCNDAHVECESKAFTSGSGFGDISNSSDAQVDKKLDSLEDRHMKEKSSSFWSNSVLPAKGLRWRLGGASKSGRFGDKQLESKHDLRHSFDWRVCCESHESHDSSRGTWEKPRLSWDGSVMSKALTCSFACLEEPQDGSSRIKRRLPEETVVADSDRCSGTIDVTKADNGSLMDEKSSSPSANLGSLPRERRHEEFHQEINAMDGSRKKSHRWSRVWYWSITSPFRDFAKKREHILERSLSGSWQEAQKDKGESHISIHSYGNGLHAPRTNQCLNRNINSGNAELQKFRSDWQRKREYRFGRSRSVHYPSPGNMDNGLLRFYLTPMRTSRRSSNSGRMRSSRFFAKGILGH